MVTLSEEDNSTNNSGIHARAVPVSPSYFSRQPLFNDSYLLLAKLADRYRKLPLIPKDQVQPVAWKNLVNFRQAVGEHVKATEFVKCMELVKTLNQIHPALRPKEVDEALVIFKKAVQPYANLEKVVPIDKFGRALGTGRRKTSVARAWLVEGTGEMLVNGKSLADAFGRVHDRESATWALRSTGRTDKYNVWALVEGGGTTGQAEALTLAVAKALLAHEPALKPALRRGMYPPSILLPCLVLLDTETNASPVSWLCYPRPSQGRKEEAWPCQGKKDARLGQEIDFRPMFALAGRGIPHCTLFSDLGSVGLCGHLRDCKHSDDPIVSKSTMLDADFTLGDGYCRNSCTITHLLSAVGSGPGTETLEETETYSRI
jgi:small subunit ribosomal protein S9